MFEYTVCLLVHVWSVMSNYLQPHGPQPSGSYPWDFPGKNAGMGCHFLIFPTQGQNPRLSSSPAFWQANILPLSHLLEHRVKRQDEGQGIEQVMWQEMKWVANGGPCLQ